jgi:cytochrome c oxidase cbb3-type subunit 1
VLLTTQKVIHFTDWVVGHAHLIMYGTFGFWIMGFFAYLWPKVKKAEPYSRTLDEWAFWLVTIGMATMWIDLVSAGLVQGFNWWGLSPFIDSVNFSVPFWVVRAISGVMITAGFVLFAYNMFMTGRRAPVSALEAQTSGGAA